MHIVNGRTGTTYDVWMQVAETPRYRLYKAGMEGVVGDLLLQVAATLEHNGSLDRAAYILKKLEGHAEALEEKYAEVKDDPKHFLNYQLCFPELVDTFVPADQGDRRVNILRFRGIEKVGAVVPLSTLVERDRLRVDMRTSVWIMGKLLKILVFLHDVQVSMGDATLGNILIEPDQHYVILFNWADAQVMQEGLGREQANEEVMAMARNVIEVLGGSLDEGIPGDGSPEHRAYELILLELAKSGWGSAARAHKEFYKAVDSIWPRGFYRFTTFPR